MDDFASTTLIIKAPNQRVEDKTVAVHLGWTVSRLKDYLSDIYPEKPSRDQQKLVYYGKLLSDEAYLKDILTQESYDGAHTVHLVCHHFASNRPLQSTYKPRNISPSAGFDQGEASLGANRLSQPPFPVTQDYVHQPSHTNPSTRLMANTHVLTPQQRFWLQAQQHQMALFLSLVSQGAFLSAGYLAQDIPPHPDQTTPPVPEWAYHRAAGQPGEDQAQLNAQGGVDANAEQEEHDWLDTIYEVFRIVLLTSIVFFYSSFERFIFILLICSVFYFLQHGLHQVRVMFGSPGAARPGDDAAAEPFDPLHEDAVAGVEEPIGDAVRVAPMYWAGAVDCIRTLLNFVSTFFTSLIPENPVQHN